MVNLLMHSETTLQPVVARLNLIWKRVDLWSWTGLKRSKSHWMTNLQIGWMN